MRLILIKMFSINNFMEKKYPTLTEAYESIYGTPEDGDNERDQIEIEPPADQDVDREIVVPVSLIIELIQFLKKEIAVTDDEVEKNEHLAMKDKLEHLLFNS